ncbi:amidohydrolase family protein [Agromyces ramosus]|uniref:L-fuconolactonase n=1 Tax=Agromyces ramosus TaxID=33879 RepID=A0ABU0RAC7_9MICO|nr:amidohydrolase family protein [Agromyces ramosus]MDQ0893994.1 L-fuconolactonase [Agromyces ramosus]
MTGLHVPLRMIDTHQHLWMLSERRYDWIQPEHGVLHADFGPGAVAADIVAAGITGTLLVQAADTYEDTFYMLSIASCVPGIDGVVGWVPLDRPDEARAALELYSTTPIIRGVRALTHTYDDPEWILRADVTTSLDLVSAHGYTLDYVSVLPEHLELLPELAARHPSLTIVIDHLAGPDIANGGWEPWASLIAGCAVRPNLFVKLSGLSTAPACGAHSARSPRTSHRSSRTTSSSRPRFAPMRFVTSTQDHLNSERRPPWIRHRR